MDLPRDIIVFTNPWRTQPAAGSDPSVPCLDDACPLRFPDHETRCEHYFAVHPYWRSKSFRKQPLQCRLCRKAYTKATSLKSHIKSRHRPISGDPPATQADQEALIMQSHAHRTAPNRSESQRDDEDLLSPRTLGPAPSRRTSLLQHPAVQYLKRKGSILIAPLIKKARKASVPQPHAVAPPAAGTVDDPIYIE